MPTTSGFRCDFFCANNYHLLTQINYISSLSSQLLVFFESVNLNYALINTPSMFLNNRHTQKTIKNREKKHHPLYI